MRHELSDYEWTAIKPMLPNKPRGVRRAMSDGFRVRGCNARGALDLRPGTTTVDGTAAEQQ
jgi:transposase